MPILIGKLAFVTYNMIYNHIKGTSHRKAKSDLV
jgi:hypothetical protein